MESKICMNGFWIEKQMKKIRRRVVAVFGEYGDGDFVLEPTCTESCECEICMNGFWIENVEGKIEI